MLLITLGELGMLLCRRGQKPLPHPHRRPGGVRRLRRRRTVIATFTLAIAAGASPLEAAILSNHAAGIVVGKIGTATVTPDELLASFAMASLTRQQLPLFGPPREGDARFGLLEVIR